jgi:hypothetical protein
MCELDASSFSDTTILIASCSWQSDTESYSDKWSDIWGLHGDEESGHGLEDCNTV